MASLLSRYSLEQFKWKPLQGVPKGCVRRLAGGERVHDIENRLFKGLLTMFVGCMVDLDDPVSVTKLASSARKCWCSLRFQFPVIASSIGGSDQDPMMVYTTGTLQEISYWADRTFLVHSPSDIDLEQLRTDESQKKVPSPENDLVWAHIVPGELADDGTVSRFGLLLHSHHSLLDGSSCKIIVNFYLDQLAKVLSDSPSRTPEPTQWGNELENLAPAVANILNPHETLPIPPDSEQEPSADDEYYKCMENAFTALVTGTKDTHGFRTLQKDDEWPKTRRASVLFTREESTRIITAVKTRGYTLTHVAHAALWMVIIADNPPGSESSSHYLKNFVVVDCRDRLTPSWVLYPGYALSFASIKAPISVFLTPDSSALPLDRDMLLKVAEIAKSQYRALLGSPSCLSRSAQFGEMCASLMALSGNVKMPADRSYGFISDGRGERYLNPTFRTDTEKIVLSVTSCFSSLNTSEPMFRLASWGGVIDIGADYNTNVMDAEVIMNYLNQWKRFILLIID